MEEAESPPPLPKGGYNIDWDNFDENINPFETKSKVRAVPFKVEILGSVREGPGISNIPISETCLTSRDPNFR